MTVQLQLRTEGCWVQPAWAPQLPGSGAVYHSGMRAAQHTIKHSARTLPMQASWMRKNAQAIGRPPGQAPAQHQSKRLSLAFTEAFPGAQRARAQAAWAHASRYWGVPTVATKLHISSRSLCICSLKVCVSCAGYFSLCPEPQPRHVPHPGAGSCVNRSRGHHCLKRHASFRAWGV